MTLRLPYLYHWSPERARASIFRRGLRPTCPTAVWVRPVPEDDIIPGHGVQDLCEDSIRTVCLGTSPGTAWAYSGALSAERGEVWDLWEVNLIPEDETHFRPIYGDGLDEVRVANPIPRSRCWFVGSRRVPDRGSKWHAHPSALQAR